MLIQLTVHMLRSWLSNIIKAHSTNIFFAGTVLISFSIKFLLFPSLSLRPEVFAESGTNFFFHAYSSDLWTNITAVDAGYLPWTQRIISLLVVNVFKIVHFYPNITQWIALLSIATLCSLITLPIFRKIISSDVCRFLIAISLSMVSDYELNTFINFIYFGAIFLFLMLFIDKEKISVGKVIILAIIAGIILCSKGAFIIFLPIYGLALIVDILKKQTNSVEFYLISVFFGVLQLAVMTGNMAAMNSQSFLSISTYFYFLIKSAYYLVLTYRHVLIGSILSDKHINLLFILIVVLLYFGLRKIFIYKQYLLFRFFVLGNILAFFSLFLTMYLTSNTIRFYMPSISFAISSPVAENVSTTTKGGVFGDKHFANLRNMYISNTLVFLVSLAVILNLIEDKKTKVMVLLAILYTSGAFAQVSVGEPYPSRTQSISQWHDYSNLLKEDSYCIPINPYPFTLTKNCQILAEFTVNNEENAGKIDIKNLLPESSHWKVLALMSVTDSKDNPLLEIFDQQDLPVTTIRALSKSNNIYQYYVFENGATSLGRIEARTFPKASQKVVIYGYTQ